VAEAPSRPRVLLVSAHPLALNELKRVASPVCASVWCRRFEDVSGDTTQARDAEVCVLDACVPPPSRDALLGTLLAHAPACRVVVVAETFDEDDSILLLKLGVRGLIRYTSLADQLPRALAAVTRGGYWAPRSLISRVIDVVQGPARARPAGARGARLSRREEEVLNALVGNLSNKEIAQRLYISERTVKFHVSNVLSKFGVARRSDLIVQLLQHRPAAR
jgi:DNA-binding NarL/FixJ family response regulator